MASDEAWTKNPKPKVKVEPPKDIANAANILGRAQLMFDLTHLALNTDSILLVIIILTGSTNEHPIQGISLGHHDLWNHGKDPGKLVQFKIIEAETIKTVGEFLAKLKHNHEDSSDLIAISTVFLSSNLEDASSHNVRNPPALLSVVASVRAST
ncbi:DUF1552 domain-containing protein [bacterium]|nr:DUF1552 domain-containing protein [bacterium]